MIGRRLWLPCLLDMNLCGLCSMYLWCMLNYEVCGSNTCPKGDVKEEKESLRDIVSSVSLAEF